MRRVSQAGAVILLALAGVLTNDAPRPEYGMAATAFISQLTIVSPATAIVAWGNVNALAALLSGFVAAPSPSGNARAATNGSLSVPCYWCSQFYAEHPQHTGHFHYLDLDVVCGEMMAPTPSESTIGEGAEGISPVTRGEQTVSSSRAPSSPAEFTAMNSRTAVATVYEEEGDPEVQDETWKCTYDDPMSSDPHYHFDVRTGPCWHSQTHEECTEFEGSPDPLLAAAKAKDVNAMATLFLALSAQRGVTYSADRNAIQFSDCSGNIVTHLPVPRGFSEAIKRLRDQAQ